MTYKATWDNLLKVVTICISVLFGVIALVPIYSAEPGKPGQYGIGLFLFAIYFFCYAFRPVSYILTSKNLVIHRPLKDVSFHFDEIRHVELLDDEKLKWTIRTFGVGGLFGYYGKFANSKIGNMTWYATRRKTVVLLQTADGKNIILTPDQPEVFVNDLKTFMVVPV